MALKVRERAPRSLFMSKMAILSTFSGWLSFVSYRVVLSKVSEHGWDKLVAGCLIKHIQAQKIHYRPVFGLCKGVFNNSIFWARSKFFDLLTSGDLIIELICI